MSKRHEPTPRKIQSSPAQLYPTFHATNAHRATLTNAPATHKRTADMKNTTIILIQIYTSIGN